MATILVEMTVGICWVFRAAAVRCSSQYNKTVYAKDAPLNLTGVTIIDANEYNTNCVETAPYRSLASDKLFM
ncbi:MAG: hypothetical protein LBH75_06715 [Treponema sp.]|nr:hypothetical protein [Treponema sp.]